MAFVDANKNSGASDVHMANVAFKFHTTVDNLKYWCLARVMVHCYRGKKGNAAGICIPKSPPKSAQVFIKMTKEQLQPQLLLQ